MHDVASVFMTLGLEDSQSDVPSSLGHGKKKLPLGRYLMNRLRLMTGQPEGCPHEVLVEVWEKEVRPLLEAAKKDREAISLKTQMAKVNDQYRRSLEFREKLKRKSEL